MRIWNRATAIGLGAVMAGMTVAGPLCAQDLVEQKREVLAALQPAWTTPNVPAALRIGAEPATSRSSGVGIAPVLVKNTRFLFTDEIGFDIISLAATFEPMNAGEPVNLDDPTQFMIRVHAGEVIVPPSSLQALFKLHVLDYRPRPLDDLKFSAGNGRLGAKGGLKLWSWFPGIWLPVSLKGPVTLHEGTGQLVYDPRSVNVLGIPLGGLLRVLGIRLSWLLSVDREGVELQKSKLVIDHKNAFPPPALDGAIQTAEMIPEGLRLTFADNPDIRFTPPSDAPDSYIWIQSGDVKLYNVVVKNANVLVREENPSSQLTFDLYNYRQLIGQRNTLKMAADGSITALLSTSFGR